MPVSEACLLAPLITLLAFILTAAMRAYAHSHQLIDVPGARSSHTAPTPRGGGLAIVVSFFFALIALLVHGDAPVPGPWNLSLALICGGGLVAGIGLIDDHGHVAAHWRLLVHLIAAVGVVASLESPQVFSLPTALGMVVEVVFLVWMVNLYNFMDGIDGLASLEAIFVCGAGALLFAISDNSAAAAAPLLLTAAVIGFLFWNWPRARIFMGDACSGFLGFAIGSFALFSPPWSPLLPPPPWQPLWAWVILAAVFIGDASFTLLRRALAGERIYEAHRDHAYQHAARRWGHVRVTLAVCAINLCWLWPLAMATGSGMLAPLIAVPLAYAPLLALAAWQRAGKRID
ncbi:glycosyltransferase WbpL [Betaproteobacteria bacterium]|nr:glycosyltransferase WbpL [Betaproteobacteria bacterium]GHT98892.1 glycosyltransferase WbpL [Betaproteobacteria bacterium]GHU13230.1 glycosyltransferase WbpL [Betaproteobacteria bacterium]GHU21026.1 glycosyltransferase WbpL [Betaproteobacteria bacterium]